MKIVNGLTIYQFVTECFFMSQEVLYRTRAKRRLGFGSFLINMFFLFVDCILLKIIKLKYIIHKLCGRQGLNNDEENTIRINSALRF